jgi:transposase
MKTNVEMIQEKVNQLFVGLDVHKNQWAVCMRTEEFEHKTFTQAPIPQLLYEYIKKNFSNYHVVCGYEAGFCGYWISEQLRSYGFDCLVLNPADIPGSDKESQRKTDRNDCRKIARELSKGDVQSIFQPDRTQQGFRNLFRQRNKLVKQLRTVKNNIRSLLFFNGTPIAKEYDNGNWSNAFRNWLKELSLDSSTNQLSLDSMLRRLDFLHQEYLSIQRQLINYAQTYHKENFSLLKTVPGIGNTVSIALLSEIGDISRFKRIDDLCSYVGLVPNIYQSGDTLKVNGLTNRCQSMLRSLLIESAWMAVRKDPELIDYYKKHVGKKPSGKIIVKVARKLLVRIYYTLKFQRPYIINYKSDQSNIK